MSRFARHAMRVDLVASITRQRLVVRTFHTTVAGCDRDRRSGDPTATDRWGSSIQAATTGERGGPLSDVTTRACSSSLRGLILSNTVLSREHLTPEIVLHLITPECDIYHRPAGAGCSADGAPTFPADPFWGFFWPGGQALTRFILDDGRPLFRGKSVLDVGCGCGASAIAARMVGARSVTANDIDEVALQATLLNAKVNGIVATDGEQLLRVCGDNVIASGEDGAATAHCEIVLIGDLFYDTEIAAILHPWIHRLARAGKKIFIGDPGRHGITETGVLSRMILRARYELPANVCLENNGFSHANVWQYVAAAEDTTVG